MQKSKESLKSRLTATEEKLVRKLFAVWKDKEFALGVISNLTTDEERQAIIDLIDKNKNIKPEQITVVAINIGNNKDFIVDDFYSWMDDVEVNE